MSPVQGSFPRATCGGSRQSSSACASAMMVQPSRVFRCQSGAVFFLCRRPPRTAVVRSGSRRLPSVGKPLLAAKRRGTQVRTFVRNTAGGCLDTPTAVHSRSSPGFSPDEFSSCRFPPRSPPSPWSAAAVGGLEPPPTQRLPGPLPVSCAAWLRERLRTSLRLRGMWQYV